MEIESMDELQTALVKGSGELFNVGLPEKIYRSHEAISQSDAKVVVTTSPRHYLKSRMFPIEKETPALILGKAMHTAFFEPHLFNERHAVQPEINRRTKSGKVEFEEFQQANDGKSIITTDQKHIIDRMMENIRKEPKIQKYITGGEVERCFFAHPPDPYGDRIPVSLKCRTDYWIEERSLIVDLKTTMNAAMGPFTQSVKNYSYYLQDAWYTDLLSNFVDDPTFIFIVVEKVQPWDVAVYELDPGYLKQGRAIYREALRILAHCFQNDDWPGYSKQVQRIECPEWTIREWKKQLLESLE